MSEDAKDPGVVGLSEWLFLVMAAMSLSYTESGISRGMKRNI